MTRTLVLTISMNNLCLHSNSSIPIKENPLGLSNGTRKIYTPIWTSILLPNWTEPLIKSPHTPIQCSFVPKSVSPFQVLYSQPARSFSLDLGFHQLLHWNLWWSHNPMLLGWGISNPFWDISHPWGDLVGKCPSPAQKKKKKVQLSIDKLRTFQLKPTNLLFS